MSPVTNGHTSEDRSTPDGTHSQETESKNQQSAEEDGELRDIDDDDEEDGVDYYGLLGLTRDPPPKDSEIRSAYHNLALSFHPDRQPSRLREAADRQFKQIHEAYETLIDPQKRTVYDLLGVEGVRREWGPYGAMKNNREVGFKAMSTVQFRRWFLKTMKGRERQAVNSLVHSRVSNDHAQTCVFFTNSCVELSQAWDRCFRYDLYR